MPPEPPSRRDFLRVSGAAALSVAAAQTPFQTLHAQSELAPQAPSHQAPLPPHRSIQVPGIHAYPNQHSVEAGSPIQFHISSTEPYELAIFRLGHAVDDRSTDECLHVFETAPPLAQPIHPGSYVHVPNGLTAPCSALSLECWIRPWNLQRAQGLLTQHTAQQPSGFALWLLPHGAIGFQLGLQEPPQPTLRETAPALLSLHTWHHVIAIWNGQSQQIWVDGRLADQWDHPGVFLPNTAPIRLGAAASDEGVAQHFLDGDLATPALYAKALSPADIQRQFALRGLFSKPPTETLGFWPLSEETGDHVADTSGHLRHGTIINLGTWMIGGPSFDATRVPRYDDSYDPSKDPTRGHALRLASDDLYDCRWKPTHTWLVPAHAAPGLYMARIRSTQVDTQKRPDSQLTFLVRRLPAAPKAPFLVLCSTSTWTAYNAAPFCQTIPAGTLVETNGHHNSHPEAPAYSCYRNHRAGQPAYQFGLRMPWPIAGPEVHYSPPGTGYSHLMRAERFLHVWLQQSGYAFDIASDLDLHQNPSLLNGYRTVILNSHSEYWSAESYDALDRYLTQGGSTIVLSGNSVFWRTSFSKDGSVMECRKLDEKIGGRQSHLIGELYHSHDRKRGSLLRECGRPAWALIGLECLGWGGANSTSFGVYEAESPDHFLFQTPENVDLAQGATFGHSADQKSVRAVGHEWDVRLSRLRAITHFIPEGAKLPEEPQGIVTLALGRRGSGGALDYFTRPTQQKDGVLAEMIYWERPQGGRVFNAGVIGYGWTLHADPKLQALLRNVLHHFGVPSPKR